MMCRREYGAHQIHRDNGAAKRALPREGTLTWATYQGPASRNLCRQPFTPASAPPGQHLAAIFGGHSSTETMGTLSLQNAGLECTLHGIDLLTNCLNTGRRAKGQPACLRHPPRSGARIIGAVNAIGNHTSCAANLRLLWPIIFIIHWAV